MTRKMKNLFKKMHLQKIYMAYLQWKDERTASRFTCSVGDILLKRDTIKNNQFLLTSRLMDVEAYLEYGDKSFPYQNAISRKAYGDAHRENDGNRSFSALIASYLKDGYHTDSYITCDKDMILLDGNHRMGLHIYEKIETVNVRHIHRSVRFPYATDWYYRAGLPSGFISSIVERFDQIQSWLLDTGNTFCAVVGRTQDDDLSPMQDLLGLVTPLRHVVFALPYVGGNQDNSLQWGGVVQFSLVAPEYEVISGCLVSRRVVEIERILNARYGGKVQFKISRNCLEGKQLFDSVSHLVQ